MQNVKYEIRRAVYTRLRNTALPGKREELNAINSHDVRAKPVYIHIYIYTYIYRSGPGEHVRSR